MEENQLLPGFLSDEDIVQVLDKDIVICGYAEENLTDIGYNLTPTEFIFSINRGLLVKIYNDNNQKYCYVEPNDTVLIITREAVWVSENISGTFHSKVKIVSKGFGHISTTLDAHWEGPLLISLNNPTKKRLKFVLGEDKGKGFKYSSFVTLVFYRMITPAKKEHDNLPCRLDILKNIVKRPRHINLLPNQYDKLENVIDVIRNFESFQVNIGQADIKDRESKIQQFRDKYEDFARKLEFHIKQAHEINNQIVRFNKILEIGINSIIIVGLVFWTVKAYFKDDSDMLALIAIIVSIYGIIYPKIISKKGE